MLRAGIASVFLLALTLGCVPDVNVIGIRGEGGQTTMGAGAGATTGAGAGGSGNVPFEVAYRNNGAAMPKHPGNGSACTELVCPPGWRVLSGGGSWSAGMLPMNGPNIILEASRPKNETTWELCGSTDTANTHAWYVEAICARGIETSIVTNGPVAHPGSSACLAALCPEGWAAVGGGGAWESAGGAPFKIRWDGSVPNAEREWTTCGYADEPGHMWTAYAVCAPLSVTRHAVTSNTHANGGECLSAACPAGKVLTACAADWDISDNPNNTITADALRPSNDGCTICSFSDVAGSHGWSVDAICH